jgi:hypothetical protein
MKVRYEGESSPIGLLNGKIYEVVAIEDGWYRIVDETEEDYLYPPEAFVVTEPNSGEVPVYTLEEAIAIHKDGE